HFIYDGYLRCLRIIDHFTARSDHNVPHAEVGLPSIAVLIAVHNEAHQIVERVQNVLAQDYPRDLLEVIVASDGSTDHLATVVAEHFGEDVRLVNADRRGGKSLIQNRAIEATSASIVLFSDADTRFKPGFLRALVAPFADECVGAVQAHLLFVPADPSSPLAGQDRYWRSELEIRKLEARLGILAVASGACIALRRELWRELDPGIGEDCVIPLDVVLQSRKVAYAEDAIAYEPTQDELGNVIGTRARMTLRNWQGTWSRSALLNPFTHPGYAFALWSHKILRWLSPVWLLGLSISAFALPFVSSSIALLLPAAAMVTFYFLATVGGLAQARSRRVPLCTAVYAFILANVGFLSGLVKAARGVTISGYRNQPVPAAAPVNRS
ncbi:MAG: glycosyltransferase, partial [Acidimicrobiia bacterium]|nr:glycosyltransferase [Acidimicrobiia bacterium]